MRAAAVTATKCGITFKTRTAYHKGDRLAHTILPHAKEWGAEAVTLHGRTREQRYSKLADWEYIHQARSPLTLSPAQGACSLRAGMLPRLCWRSRHARRSHWRCLSLWVHRQIAVHVQVGDAMPTGVQLIGNGDVFSYEDFDAHLRSGTVCFPFCSVLHCNLQIHSLIKSHGITSPVCGRHTSHITVP